MLAKLKSWLFFCAGQGFRKGLLAGMLLPVGTVIFSIAYSISQGSIPIDLGRLVFESLTVAVHLLLFTVSLGALLGLIMAVAMGIILVFALGLALRPVSQGASLLLGFAFACMAALFVAVVTNTILGIFSVGQPDFVNQISAPAALLAFYMTFTSRDSAERFLGELN